MLTNYCGLWKERPDREFALFIKFIISHKRRQIGHIFIWLFFIIFRRTINSHSQWVPQVTKHPVYHYTIVFNNCLNSYYFPSNWKIAKIKALKKGKEGINPSNYWPISLLSNISKIFGTIINDSINSFCTDNSIISETQFGFRYKHSTIHGNNHKIYIRHMLDKKCGWLHQGGVHCFWEGIWQDSLAGWTILQINKKKLSTSPNYNLMEYAIK